MGLRRHDRHRFVTHRGDDSGFDVFLDRMPVGVFNGIGFQDPCFTGTRLDGSGIGGAKAEILNNAKGVQMAKTIVFYNLADMHEHGLAMTSVNGLQRKYPPPSIKATIG
jgi:hypothetical protein